jgi:hypothetical protein
VIIFHCLATSRKGLSKKPRWLAINQQQCICRTKRKIVSPIASFWRNNSLEFNHHKTLRFLSKNLLNLTLMLTLEIDCNPWEMYSIIIHYWYLLSCSIRLEPKMGKLSSSTILFQKFQPKECSRSSTFCFLSAWIIAALLG